MKAVAEGAGEIICYAFRAGSPLGSLTIRPEVVAAGQETGARDTAEGTFPSGPKAVPADLELIVLTERDAAGQPVLRYLLNAGDPTLGLNLKPFGPVPITGGPAAYFFSLFADISAIPVDTANLRRIAAERLTAIGSTLFSELFPDDLQALLWGLRDRIGSVLIQSEEPWVPWELCRLQGREDGRIVEGPFLCEAFDITRWMPGLARQPDLKASSIGVIQPPSDLASAPRETEMLQGLATSGPPARTVTAIPPNYSAVRAALGEATYEVVHFVGHGRFPDANDPKRAELSLTGTQALRPIDISGAVANLGLRRPIVFLNACQSGVKAVDLTGNGGWAVAMLEAGSWCVRRLALGRHRLARPPLRDRVLRPAAGRGHHPRRSPGGPADHPRRRRPDLAGLHRLRRSAGQVGELEPTTHSPRLAGSRALHPGDLPGNLPTAVWASSSGTGGRPRGLCLG